MLANRRDMWGSLKSILKERYTAIPAIFKEPKSPSKRRTVATKPTAPLPAKVRRMEMTHGVKEALQQPAKVRRTEATNDKKEALQQALKIAQIAHPNQISSHYLSQATQDQESAGADQALVGKQNVGKQNADGAYDIQLTYKQPKEEDQGEVIISCS